MNVNETLSSKLFYLLVLLSNEKSNSTDWKNKEAMKTHDNDDDSSTESETYKHDRIRSEGTKIDTCYINFKVSTITLYDYFLTKISQVNAIKIAIFSVIQVILLLIGICCWLFWFCCYMSQMNPLIGPILNQRTLIAVKQYWVSQIFLYISIGGEIASTFFA